jgi:hypothetical protein
MQYFLWLSILGGQIRHQHLKPLPMVWLCWPLIPDQFGHETNKYEMRLTGRAVTV